MKRTKTIPSVKAITVLLTLMLIMTVCGCASGADSQASPSAASGTDVSKNIEDTDSSKSGGEASSADSVSDPAPADASVSADTSVPADTSAPSDTPASDVYGFTFGGMTLVPNASFDAEALTVAANSTYEVPSCALAGMDIVYAYNELEVTAMNDGTGEFIYSIYITDPNTPTPEGLYLGDSREQMEAIYGTDYTENGTEITYTKEKTQLIFLLGNGFITSIEYRALIG